MFRTCFHVLLLAAFLACAPEHYARAAGPSAASALVEGNDTFAFDLYARLKSADGNLFFSPHSISTCLAMTYGGARNETAREMARVLHLDSSQDEVAKAFAALQAQLNEMQVGNALELNIANGLWAQKQHAFLPAFLQSARAQYQANVNEVDFATAAEPARKEINDWVSAQTKGKITDLLRPGVINSGTRLALVNAIYFKGRWAEPFKPGQTAMDSFTTAAARKVQTPLMHLKARFRYAELDGLQLLELPYASGETPARGTAPAPLNAPPTQTLPGAGQLSLMVLLPKEADGLKALESSLKETALTNWLAKAARQEVEVYLPKFKMTAQFSLAGELSSMGMAGAFSRQADFSGMDGQRDLFISALVHKAFVEVNEEGTEAAAATGTVMAMSALVPRPAPVFRADHPFIFLIRDGASGSILFLGRMVDPTN